MAEPRSAESGRSPWSERLPLLSAGIATLLTFLIALASLLVLHGTARSVLKERLDEELTGIARLAALCIPAAEHALLTRPEQTNGSDYAILAERLRDIAATMPDITYIYTVRSTPEGLRFVLDGALPIDSDEDRVNDQAMVGDLCEHPDEALLRAIANAAPTVGERPYTDRWGTFLGAYAPIRHADGRLEAVLGVDVEVGAYEAHLARMRRTLWGSAIVALSLSLAVGCGTLLVQRSRRRADAAEERIRRALRLAQGRLNAAVHSARVGLWEWQPANDSIWWSDECAGLLGAADDPPSRAGSAWRSILHPEDADRLERALAEHLAGGSEEVRVECRTRHAAGGERWLEVFGRISERDGEGRATRLSGALLDIGPYKAATRRVESSQRRIALILETAAAGVTVYDTEGRLLECNREAERILGLGRAELSALRLPEGGWRVTDVSGRPFATEELPALVTLRTGRSCRDVQMGFRRSDGQERWLLVNTEPLHRASPTDDRPGPVAGVVVSFADVTAAHEARQALEAAKEAAESASRAKSEFLASMSHEIRTPMTAILGFARLLEEDPATRSDPALARDAIATIRRNGEHLLAIINDILDFSKIEAGRMTVERVPTSPREAAEDVVALLGAEAARRGLALTLAVADDAPGTLETDPVRLRQILTNLVANAIKFTQRGEVALRVGRGQDDGEVHVAFDVRDTGIGIEAAVLARLFRPFTQADASTSRRYGGTGLGLAISLRLARLLGGEIEAMSEPGTGSVFTLRLPIGAERSAPVPAAAAAPAATAASPLGDALAGARLLVVDDGADNRILIERLLRSAGAAVRAVDGGRAALEILAAVGHGFDAVLLDMDMPELDGFEVMRRLADSGCRIPIVAVTAHASEVDRDRARAAGCVDHVAKPIDPERLIAVCMAALRTKPEVTGEFT